MAKKAKARSKPAARKAKQVQPIPAGYHTVTAYLSIKGAGQAIDFYKRAFGAKEIVRIPGPNGTVGHAELKIGDSLVMLADESPDMGFLGPHARGGTTIQLHLYVRGCRRDGREGSGRRCQAHAAHRGQVLRRPRRHYRGSIRPRLVHRHA